MEFAMMELSGWMVHSIKRWPKQEIGEVQEKICMVLGLVTRTKITSAAKATIIDVERFLSLRELIRTLLFVLRFMAKVSGGKIKSFIEFTKEGKFTSSDYDQAKKLVVRVAQSEVSQEFIEKWGLVRDAEGIWRSLGRLRWSRSELINFPHFICRGRIAKLIVQHEKMYHEKMFHASSHLHRSKFVKHIGYLMEEHTSKSFLRNSVKDVTGGMLYPLNSQSFTLSIRKDNCEQTLRENRARPLWSYVDKGDNRTVSKR